MKQKQETPQKVSLTGLFEKILSTLGTEIDSLSEPFQERNNRLREEYLRLVEYMVGKGYASGLIPLDLGKEVSGGGRKHSGRKISTRRRKVS